MSIYTTYNYATAKGRYPGFKPDPKAQEHWSFFFQEYCPNITAWVAACSNVHVVKMDYHKKKDLRRKATDDMRYVNSMKEHIMNADRIFVPEIDTRGNSSEMGNFEIDVTESELAARRLQQVDIDVFLDISMLSQCDYLIHGLSAVTEVALYVNPELAGRALNLELRTINKSTATVYEQGRAHSMCNDVADK
eukprot:gene22266-26858_t